MTALSTRNRRCVASSLRQALRSVIEGLENRTLLSTSIVSGQTLAGSITSVGQQVQYTFTASAGNSFDISLGDANSASGFHPYLQVLAPGGTRVINAGTGNTNTSVSGIYTVPAAGAGTYTVFVQDNNGNATGEYDLELAKAPASQAADSNGDGGVISSGQTKAGTINRTGDLDIFTFSAAANDSFELSLGDAIAASGFHPYLQIYDPSGSRVVNAGTGNTNTSVNGVYFVPANGAGTYTGIVQDNNGNATGTYDLELAKAPAAQAVDSNGDGGVISSGQTKAGTINRTGDLDIFTFSASANDSFELSLGDANAASGFRPYLQVYNPAGARVINVGTGNTNTSVNGVYFVPANGAGTYTAFVQDNYGDGNGVGAYNLELAKAPAAQAVDSNGDGGVISSGQTKAGAINRTGDLDIFTFLASANDSFELSLGDTNAASGFRPYLQVYNPAGARVINAGTGNTNTSVNGVYFVPANGAGTYTAFVQDNYGNGIGAYNLELAKAPAAQAVDSNGDGGVISSGQTKAGAINRTGDLDIFTFSASANDSFELSLGDTNAASGFRPYLQVYNPAGVRVINVGTGNTNTSVNGVYFVPANGAGTYTAFVQDNYGDGNGIGAYSLELAKAPAAQAVDSNGDSGVISSGQTKAGTINRTGDLDIFTFSVSDGDSFDISLGDANAASGFRPYLQVYNSGGTRIINVGTGNTNTSVSGIYSVPLAGAGIYTAIVQDNYGDAIGAYDLELVKAPAAQAVDSNGDGGVIASGDDKTGTINRTGDLDVFTFSASVGDTFGISLADANAASGFHPYLQLYSPSGTRVINIGTGNTNTAVSGIYTVPAAGAGTFTVIVQDNSGNATGAYDLKLTGTIHPIATITVTPPVAQTATAGVAKSFKIGGFTATNATSPFSIDISWGDGTTHTKISVNAAGTIPAQSHTYAAAATDTVSIIITDSKSHKSNTATFKVTIAKATSTGSIAGNVFKDLNANGVLNTGETGFSGVKVFLDTNKNGTADTGETSVTTDSSGNYKFGALGAGTYRVREVLPSGYKLIAPAAGFTDVTIAAGAVAAGKNFADAPATASITGEVFNDANANGKLDATELGLGLWQVYIDVNNNGKLDTGDPNTTTDVNGKWSFTGLTAGSYVVRVVQVTGTATTTTGGAVQTVVLASAQAVSGKLFGEKRIA